MAAGDQVIAVYDYEAVNDGDLGLYEGMVLTIVTPEEDGWMEGCAEDGAQGFFPANYVEAYSGGGGPQEEPYDGPGDGGLAEEDADAMAAAAVAGAADWEDTEDSDEWDMPSAASLASATGALEVPGGGGGGGGGGSANPLDRVRSDTSRPLSVLSAPTVDLEEQNSVDHLGCWQETEPYFFIEVTNPEQRKKLGGFKKYTAYHVTVPSKGWSVLRRYKHFDWLHERLERKFIGIPIPPLPDKQATGRFKDNFVEQRRVGLKWWLNQVARHPLLRSCGVFTHFLSIDDQQQRETWKTGKRHYEKEAAQGENWYFSVDSVIDAGPELASQLDASNAAIAAETTHLGGLEKIHGTQEGTWLTMGKTMGAASHVYTALAQAVDDEHPTAQTALDAIATAASAMASEMEAHAAAEHVPLDYCHEQRTRIKLMQRAMKVEQSSRQRYLSLNDKLERRAPEAITAEDTGKLQVLQAAADRKLIVARAETSFYKEDRLITMKQHMQSYIAQQIHFLESCAEHWRQAAAAVDAIDVDEGKFPQEPLQ